MRKRKANANGSSLGVSLTSLSLQATLARPASWTTPAARDWKDTAGMNTERPDGRSRVDQLPRQAQLASWPTTTSDADRGGQAKRMATGRSNLRDAVMLSVETETEEPNQDPSTDSGTLQSGSPAPTEKPGQLNPALSLWLMGLPPEWIQAAPWKRSRGRRS